MPKSFESILVVVVVLFCLVISILDVAGLLDLSSWLPERRLLLILLLLVSTVCGYMVLEGRTHFLAIQGTQASSLYQLGGKLESGLENVIASLKGVHLTVFKSDVELLKHLVVRLETANQVSDLTWEKNKTDRSAHTKERKDLEVKYQEMISKMASAKPCREIFVFNRPDRLRKLMARLHENMPEYSCAYFPAKDANVPLLQYIIIDDEAIFSSDELPVLCAVKNPQVVEILKHYYDAAWEAATKIKVKDEVYKLEVKKVMRYGNRSHHSAN